jgi:hypothetical protein
MYRERVFTTQVASGARWQSLSADLASQTWIPVGHCEAIKISRNLN